MRQRTREEYEVRIEAAVDYILRSLDEPLTPSEVAWEAGYSPFHFSRVFSADIGETLGDFVRRLRMERAAHRLATTETSISEVAMDAGYESLEAFGRAFKNAYRVTPSEWKVNPRRPDLQSQSGVHFRPDGERDVIHHRLKPGQSMTAQIEQIPNLRLLAFRHVGPYNQIGHTFDKLFAWGGPRGVNLRGTVAIYHDDPGSVAPEALRSDACAVVPEDYVLPDDAPEGATLSQIEAGEYAVGLYVGPYEGIGDAWGRFMGQAFPALGRQPGPGPCFEWYLNDPEDTTPDKLETKLCTRIV